MLTPWERRLMLIVGVIFALLLGIAAGVSSLYSHEGDDAHGYDHVGDCQVEHLTPSGHPDDPAECWHVRPTPEGEEPTPKPEPREEPSHADQRTDVVSPTLPTPTPTPSPSPTAEREEVRPEPTPTVTPTPTPTATPEPEYSEPEARWTQAKVCARDIFGPGLLRWPWAWWWIEVLLSGDCVWFTLETQTQWGELIIVGEPKPSE